VNGCVIRHTRFSKRMSALTRTRGVALLVSLRPAQWTKNLILFAGLIFGEKLFDPSSALAAGLAFAVFCALSGVVYLVNDIRDVDADRQHPTKSRRPIAAGELPLSTAWTAAAILTGVALAVAFWLDRVFFGVALAYLLLLTLYSTALKHHAIIDVITIAAGFVLRAVAGVVVIHVAISHWLLVLTLLLALFLALSKRRAEMVTLVDGGSGHRRSLADYSPQLLDQLITIVASSTLLAYAFYTISPETVARLGTDRLLFTLPFPLYGIFRYLYLIHQRDGGANPSETLLQDRPILACVGLWALTVAVLIYGPWR
jgi:4-hydroxybenzoate polyprenyltransferase